MSLKAWTTWVINDYAHCSIADIDNGNIWLCEINCKETCYEPSKIK